VVLASELLDEVVALFVVVLGLVLLVGGDVVLGVVVDEELVEPEASVLAEDDDVVAPVGPLVDVSVGVPTPVGLFGVAGSGGAADSLVAVDVDGVTGGTAVVVVELVCSVRLQPATSAADIARARARAVGLFMGFSAG
jgi:hypothetical protein